jgi:maltooligosyltrehalose trehalohydrolase
VWAPLDEQVAVHLLEGDRVEKLTPSSSGYHEAIVDDLEPGALYRYVLGDDEVADPAARWQPDGVHGPSAVLDASAFAWSDAGFTNPRLERSVFYELHVGTFTEQGTFDAAVEHLDDLVDLGITTVEVMPIAEFPGARNWGYDGVLPYAAASAYGGPHGFARFVDACHARGLAVCLDVVYNHMGPEGGVLERFGPYFTDRYRTPWGSAINVDGPQSDEVRRYLVDNALMWVRDFRVDALRLDAIHGIFDMSPYPFLRSLAEEVHAAAEATDRRIYVIAESESNDPRVVADPVRGGLGMDAQWSDDFHHALHAAITGERGGYYADYGTIGALERAITQGFVYQGQYSAYRRRSHGAPAPNVRGRHLLVCAQNHDQVGNRPDGERLSVLIPFERQKVVAGLVLLQPSVPLLFMGEEYGEIAPFLYFVSHSDPDLIDAVRRGRAREFAGFGWGTEPPDPQDERTFERSKLDRSLRRSPQNGALWELHRELLSLRRTVPALASASNDTAAVRVDESTRILRMRRWTNDDEAVVIANLGTHDTTIDVSTLGGLWRVVLDTADERWGGPGRLTPEELGEGSIARVRPDSLVVLHHSEESA